VHPGQLATINATFTPSPAEIAEARAVLDALAEAEARGAGVVTDPNGRMLDRAMIRAASETLSRAGTE
jgi:citrate lyase subunit beta/citryl-CoA lyase